MMKSQTQTLPTDIEFDILSRLPVKTLSRFKSVSKQWLALIAEPQFIKTHLHKYNNKSRKLILGAVCYPSAFYSLDLRSPNDPVVHLGDFNVKHTMIKSSCYGLLLIFMHRDKQYIPFLWNPSTKSIRKIPVPDNLKALDIQGIGYDSTWDDFKVFMVGQSVPFDYQSPCVVHVFSFRTSSWKRIQNIHNLRCGRNVVLEGVLYWVANSGTNYSNASCKNYVIVYFDPNEAKMKELLPCPKHKGVYDLTVLGEKLCVVDSHEIGIDVWVMKESSWSKMLGFTHSSYLDFLRFKYPPYRGSLNVKPLCFTGENDVVIMIYRHLVIFNMKENTFELIESPSALEYIFTDAECYVESLVSPYFGFGTRS